MHVEKKKGHACHSCEAHARCYRVCRDKGARKQIISSFCDSVKPVEGKEPQNINPVFTQESGAKNRLRLHHCKLRAIRACREKGVHACQPGEARVKYFRAREKYFFVSVVSHQAP